MTTEATKTATEVEPVGRIVAVKAVYYALQSAHGSWERGQLKMAVDLVNYARNKDNVSIIISKGSDAAIISITYDGIREGSDVFKVIIT